MEGTVIYLKLSSFIIKVQRLVYSAAQHFKSIDGLQGCNMTGPSSRMCLPESIGESVTHNGSLIEGDSLTKTVDTRKLIC